MSKGFSVSLFSEVFYPLFLESMTMKLIAIIVKELLPLDDVLSSKDANSVISVDQHNLRFAVWLLRVICKS